MGTPGGDQTLDLARFVLWSARFYPAGLRGHEMPTWRATVHVDEDPVDAVIVQSRPGQAAAPLRCQVEFLPGRPWTLKEAGAALVGFVHLHLRYGDDDYAPVGDAAMDAIGEILVSAGPAGCDPLCHLLFAAVVDATAAAHNGIIHSYGPDPAKVLDRVARTLQALREREVARAS